MRGRPLRIPERFPEPELETRAVERAGTVVEVTAPRGWSTARIEAWLDWAEAIGATGEGPLGGGPDAFARKAAARGVEISWFDDAEASAFVAQVSALCLSGVVGLGGF